MLGFGSLSFHLTADDVEQLGGDAGLTEFVVFEVEFFEQLGGVVAGGLHRHHARGLFAGRAVGEHILHHRPQIQGQHTGEDGIGIGLEQARGIGLGTAGLGGERFGAHR